MPEATTPLEIFFSYAHEDEKLLEQLNNHLSSLKQEALIDAWYDRDISAGTPWVSEIDTHLNTADIILLLVSANFMASDYCSGIEAKRALERHDAGEARVIPIILKPTDWHHSPIGSLQALPLNGKAVTSWSDRDQAFLNIAEGIRKAVEEMAAKRSRQKNVQRIFHVPFERNPYFIRDDSLFQKIQHAFNVSNIQVLSGMGGVGKTQTAIEYAYRFQERYLVILWANVGAAAVSAASPEAKAESSDLLTTELASFAVLLDLPGQRKEDKNYALAAVKQWLVNNKNWLLILDNIEDPKLVREFIPQGAAGHIVLTSQAHATSTMQETEIKKMEPDEGALFLLRRARIIDPKAGLEDASANDIAEARKLVELLGGLPLALDQAGAYIESTGCSLEEFQTLFAQQKAQFLSQRIEADTGHPYSVAATLSLSIEKIRQAYPAATHLFSLCSFLHPDAIPEEIFMKAVDQLGAQLQALVTDALVWNKMLGAMRMYSLLRRNPAEKTLTIHRLLQTMFRIEMSEEAERQWAERAVRMVNVAFPDVEFLTWKQCQRLIAQVQGCATLIEQYNFTFPEAARLLNEAGYYLYELGRYKEAEPLLLQAVKIREQTLGPDHPDVATSLNHLAETYREQSKFAQADPLYKRALTIREKVLGLEHPDTATSFNNLGRLYDDQGKIGLVKELYQKALDIRQKMLGLEHSDTATSLNNLAGLYKIQGKYAQAEPLLKETLRIKEKVLGTEHPDTATSLNNLAALYRDQGKYAQAEPLLQRALTIRETIFGPEHPDTASSLSGLAILYKTQGKYTQAEPLLRRALRIRETVLGPEHPDTASSLNNLASFYETQGKYTQAEPLSQQALRIRETVLGPEHPDTASSLNNLAGLYQTQGKYTQAEPLLQQALRIQEAVLGPEHPDTASSLNNLAVLYEYQGKYTQAKPLLQRALRIRETVLGPEHPATGNNLNNLAGLYASQKNYVQAKQLYQQALTIFEKVLGTKHPDVANTLFNLAVLFSNQRNFTQAEPLFKRAIRVYEQSLRYSHPTTIRALNGYASMLRAARRNGRAAEVERRVKEAETQFAQENG